jgi:hypothetical protein
MLLWRWDQRLSRTTVGTLGEYMLYEFRK